MIATNNIPQDAQDLGGKRNPFTHKMERLIGNGRCETMSEAVTMKAKEAAVYVGISYWLLLELTKKRELPYIAAGGRKLFRKESLDQWMANSEEQSVQTKPEPAGYGTLRKVNK